MTSKKLLNSECLGRFWHPSMWGAGLLVAILTAVLSLVFILTNIIYGRNYSPFIIRIDGVSDKVLPLLAFDYRSPFGSTGTLRYDEEFKFFRTEKWSQPIASVKLRCPVGIDLKDVRATLWYMNINSAYGGIPLDGGGQVIERLDENLGESVGGFQAVDLKFKSLSSLSISRYSRAMNWKGDLSLISGALVRSGTISLGFVLCLYGLSSFPGMKPTSSHKSVGLEPVNSSRHRAGMFGSIAAWISLILVLGAVIYNRDKLVFRSPSMEFEDGTSIFAYFYENRGIAELLRFKFGYVPLVPNIIGYISVKLPRLLVPYWMSLIPAVVAVVFYSMPFHACYRSFFPSRTSAWVTCIILCLAPLGSQLLYSNTDYMIWNLLGILFLLALVDPAESKSRSVLLAVLLFLLICSHPLSLLLLVILGLRWAFEGSLRWYWLFAAGVTLLYQSFGVEHDSVARDLGLAGQLARMLGVAYESALVCVKLGLRGLCGPVIFEKYISVYLEGLLGNSAILGAVVALGVLFSQVTRHRRKMAIACSIIFFITFLCIWSRGIDWVSDFGFHNRYTYIQSMIFLSLASCLLFWGLDWGQRRFSGSLFDAGNLPTMILGCVLIGWFWGQNQQRGYLCGGTLNNGSYNYASAENGLIIKDFMLRLRAQEADPAFDGQVFLEAVKVNDWKVVIDTRKEAGVQTP